MDFFFGTLRSVPGEAALFLVPPQRYQEPDRHPRWAAATERNSGSTEAPAGRPTRRISTIRTERDCAFRSKGESAPKKMPLPTPRIQYNDFFAAIRSCSRITSWASKALTAFLLCLKRCGFTMGRSIKTTTCGESPCGGQAARDPVPKDLPIYAVNLLGILLIIVDHPRRRQCEIDRRDTDTVSSGPPLGRKSSRVAPVVESGKSRRASKRTAFSLERRSFAASLRRMRFLWGAFDLIFPFLEKWGFSSAIRSKKLN